MMLKFYGYYKQATEGKCMKPKPWAWDVINKAKWDAWHSLGDMEKSEAMKSYVQSLLQVSRWKFTHIYIYISALKLCKARYFFKFFLFTYNLLFSPRLK